MDLAIAAHLSVRSITTGITVCGNVDEARPIFPGKVNRHHWGFSDPGHHQGTEGEIGAEFRNVRDEMKRTFEAYVAGPRDGATVAQPRLQRV